MTRPALPVPFPGDWTAGNPATDVAFFDSVRRMASILCDRVPVEEVGLYYSSSSQLMEMLPGGSGITSVTLTVLPFGAGARRGE